MTALMLYVYPRTDRPFCRSAARWMGINMSQKTTVEIAIETAIDWAAKFDWLKIFIPIVVSLIVFSFFARSLNELLKEAVGPNGELQKNLQQILKTSMNEELGAFRVQLRGMLATERRRHKAGLIKDAKDIERSAADEVRKQQIASHASEPDVTTRDTVNTSMQEEVDSEMNEKNWGELQAMWEQVWYWSKQQLSLAIEQEKRGRVIGTLRNANLKSPTEVISMLYRYGWYGDETSNLALEMSGLFNRHKSKKIPVDSTAIQKFRDLYSKWERIDE
jgi:hypothetical protein